MKKILLAITLLTQLPASAQSHFYIQPAIGIGLSNVTLTAEAPITALQYEPGLGYMAGARAGIYFGGLRIAMGLEYMQVASRYTPPVGNTITNTYNHLLIPLVAGYTIPTGGKFSIVPGAGAALSINFFDSYLPFKKTSIWGQAQVDVEYALHNRLSITAGPRFYYMLNSIVKHEPTSVGNVQQRHYSMLLSAGVLLRL